MIAFRRWFHLSRVLCLQEFERGDGTPSEREMQLCGLK
jgi:hypothetical protein